MRLITKNTDYAIRALGYMAGHENGVHSVSEMADSLKIPRPFLRKILQVLNKKGVLKSHKGKGGGFILGLQPSDIFLMDLIEIFQGHIELSKCVIKRGICPDIKSCMLKRKIESIERNVLTELRSTTLADLVRDGV